MNTGSTPVTRRLLVRLGVVVIVVIVVIIVVVVVIVTCFVGNYYNN